MNILMICIDMFRSNLINCYNENVRERTDIDEFFEELGGTLFRKTYTVAPDTSRSFAATFTSRYPHDNKCDYILKYPILYLPKTMPNIATFLKGEGFYLSTIKVNSDARNLAKCLDIPQQDRLVQQLPSIVGVSGGVVQAVTRVGPGGIGRV